MFHPSQVKQDLQEEVEKELASQHTYKPKLNSRKDTKEAYSMTKDYIRMAQMKEQQKQAILTEKRLQSAHN
jgi:hypothetical protein